MPSLLMTGCSGDRPGADKGEGSAETSVPVGRNMAGASQPVRISLTSIENKPEPWVLASPESAVRSYLGWASYAYRIAESAAATPTMSAAQEVRVDSYVQFNLQKSRLIDQTLKSITFGKQSSGATSVVLAAREEWTYRYVSIADVGKTVAGPYSATYDTSYTVVKNDKGDWVVDAVKVKALSEVK